MNERDDEAPFPREPWQRLLEDSPGGPPETTDARIRAAARRGLAPRARRWWLPASLAASLVLAVVLVRSELGSSGRIHVAPSANTGDAAVQGRLDDHRQREEARAPAPTSAAPAEEAESDAYDSADSGESRPELARAPEPASAPEAPAAEPAEAPAAAQSAPASAAKEARRLDEIRVTKPRPDAWYAAIEKLRAEGRIEEADRELEQLETAYPGWLEKHLEEQRNR